MGLGTALSLSSRQRRGRERGRLFIDQQNIETVMRTPKERQHTKDSRGRTKPNGNLRQSASRVGRAARRPARPPARTGHPRPRVLSSNLSHVGRRGAGGSRNEVKLSSLKNKLWAKITLIVLLQHLISIIVTISGVMRTLI